MATERERDYVLGTNDAELERLGLQHRVWRTATLEAWRRGGLTRGSRVADLGAGPGFAALDLAEIVGPEGSVLAVERSGRFVRHLREECGKRGLSQVRAVEADLMDWTPEPGHDMVWCRWVASFVPDRPALARRIAACLNPGGRAVLHEYADYRSWRFGPRRPQLEEFVAAVMDSWRDAGGEPDVALDLPRLLGAAGLSIQSLRPLVSTVRPRDYTWQWPAAFVSSNCARLVETGRVTPEWAQEVLTELVEAERDPESVMVTPLVMEVVGVRG